ncbi:segregation and condensation protein A [Candidatus Nitrosacidococcus tergens]|uniref:Segregation and condensation protein A n=1 Tax=Candidatus Nitrosacidococcus tergens TaxID=553981 RepID=A0A7G1QB84_9GAMM|nr:ScpA family protein [Candidatus Nitrosacidococcus tergens]CAB1277215.1 Segregation and condensation protein A [Candidatus Nitrosacidococcus tergens]
MHALEIHQLSTKIQAFAIIQGCPVTELPKDLYIPPDALEIFLESFEGPLDLLLYLIKKQNLNILDIPIATITHQYVEYIEILQGLRLELAAEYLVMSAWLAEIKSQMLLPQPQKDTEEEIDPRAELIRRLQEYEQYKQAAEDLDSLPRVGRDLFETTAYFSSKYIPRPEVKLELNDLLVAFKEMFTRVEKFTHHHITQESLSVRARMVEILDRVRVTPDSFCTFMDLFHLNEGRLGIVVTFLAILELIKESLIEVTQTEIYSVIHVRAIAA